MGCELKTVKSKVPHYFTLNLKLPDLPWPGPETTDWPGLGTLVGLGLVVWLCVWAIHLLILIHNSWAVLFVNHKCALTS